MTTLHRGQGKEITQQLNAEVKQIFAQWVGCANVIWDCKVAEAKTAYNKYKEAVAAGLETTYPKPDQKYAHHKTQERAYLKGVPAQICRNAASKFHEAMTAYRQGTKGFPHFKLPNPDRHCVLTRELFEVEAVEDTLVFKIKKSEKSKPFITIVLKKPKNLVGLPKMIEIRRHYNRYFLSYSYTQNGIEVQDEAAILKELSEASSEDQQRFIMGMDAGVKNPITLSTGTVLGFTDPEKKNLARKLHKRKKLQRQKARQEEAAKRAKVKTIAKPKDSKNLRKTKTKIADCYANEANIRRNMNHRVSKVIAEQAPEVKVVVCEDLKLKNLTKKPPPKQDPETKKYLPNGANAKAGLNRSLLNIGIGQILKFTAYKLKERGKLLVPINPQYSSQECAVCGHIAKANRPTRDIFCCIQCGHQDDADRNAAVVLKQRFVKQLTTPQVKPAKVVKKIAYRRQQAARLAVSVCGVEGDP